MWLPVFGETYHFHLQGRSGFHFEDSSNMFFRNVRNHLPGHLVMAYDPAGRGFDAMKFVQKSGSVPAYKDTSQGHATADRQLHH
jgi:hypothetical protein